MLKKLAAAAAVPLMMATAFAGEAEVSAAQTTIQNQIEAFRAGNDDAAYDLAAPMIKRLFPTLDQFMGMVKGGYQPVWHPKSYAFGAAEEPASGSVVQHVLIVGPDGKTYEAVYMLQLQPDGVWRISGVSLNETKTLST